MTDLEYNVKGALEELKELYDLTPEEAEEREERGEIASFGDWLNAEALDIEYTVNAHGEYLGAAVWVTVGGPSVWVDTRHGRIEGRWGTERAEIWLPSEICEALDECLADCYNCTRF